MKSPHDTDTTIAAAAERILRHASDCATDALSSMIGEPLTVATRVYLREASPDAAADESVIAAFGVQGIADSEFLAIFPDASLRTVRALVAPGMEDDPSTRDGIALEVGNICASHYLSTIADVIGMPLLPSPPRLTRGAPKEAPETDTGILRIHTEFHAASGATFRGYFVFHPATALVKALTSPTAEG